MASEAVMNGNSGGSRRLEGLRAVLTARRTHLTAPYWTFGPILLALLIYAFGFGGVSAAEGVIGLAAGLFAWTVTEYVLHRFSFHSRSTNRLAKPFTSGLHREHHNQPNSDGYLAAPMQLAVPVFLAMMGAFYLISRDTAVTALLGAGLSVGFMFYEWVHYMTHCLTPRNRFTRYLKKHHMLHHFADEQNYFGVTSPLWDAVLGTLPKKPVKRRAAAA